MRSSLLMAALVACALAGCAGPGASGRPTSTLAALRARGAKDADEESRGRWALAEMLEPGGDAHRAAEARQSLGPAGGGGLYANLARALWDEVHGRPGPAADAYVAALQAAQGSRDSLAPLIAWRSAHELTALRGSVTGLYARHRAALEALLMRPGSLGWRAVAMLEEWRAVEVLDKAELTGEAYDRLVTTRMGCARTLRLAGPFGRGVSRDQRTSFLAERPGPWPSSWPADPSRGIPPHVLPVEQTRCLAASTERTGDGVFYVETFFSTKQARDLLVAVQGAVKVWVDDTPVLERDLRTWGVWQRFGSAVGVDEGRHRVLARVLGDASSVRLLNPDGTPAPVEVDVDARRTYALRPPRLLGDPNPIEAIVRRAVANAPLDAWLAGEIAHDEGLDDVASTLIEPLVSSANAAAVALARAADFVRADPALADQVRRRNERQLRQRAVLLDGALWYSRLWLALDGEETKGGTDAVAPLRQLAAEFAAVPEVREQLARIYARLGWRAERMRTLSDLSARFPEHAGALRLYLDALEEDGALYDADRVAAGLKRLDPDSELDVDRALARDDWPAAIAELERLGKRRPDRKEIATRIAQVLARAGNASAAAAQLHRALAKDPLDSAARFRLADRAYATGDRSALRRALAEGLQAGAKTAEIRTAIDLVEGATNLEPYRIDGRKVIRDFLAWQRTGKRMEGNAARVLDYAATWVHPDGSSEMLEHEIVRIQSQEAIGKEAEQQTPAGLVLRMRVIKADGATLEPERVEGKPTLTMPHLEIGDFVEIEHISQTPGDGQKGKWFRGPHWFFREPDKGYWRSEFVAILPKDRPVVVETLGNVGAPSVREMGTMVERRWRVDLSPPAPNEPDGPKPTEFLPSVRLGWGITLHDTLVRLVDVVADETPLDPRLRRKALELVQGARGPDDQARRAYRFVLENVEEGSETDGRRVLMGKSGSRQAAFVYLMRQLGIPCRVALVKNRLAMPPLGPMSEIENWDSIVLRLDVGGGAVRWLTVRDKFAPYGYVAAELRGQPAFLLVDGTPADTTATQGNADGALFEGTADVRPDGSASVELRQSYTGKFAISMREVFDRIPQAQQHDLIESRLLARNLPGARMRELKIENPRELDEPFVLVVRAEAPQLLRPRGTQLALRAPFPMRLGQLAALPERTTPLLLNASSHVEVRFRVRFPSSVSLPAMLPSGEVRDGERLVRVNDSVQDHTVTLERVIDVPAGRVQPGAPYAGFVSFAERADLLLEREIIVGK